MLTDKQAAERRLQAFITRRLAEERDTIAPELHEYIVGNSEDEVEAAIRRAKSKTTQIIAGIRQAQAPAAFVEHVREGVSDLDAEAVRNMSVEDFGRVRTQLGVARPRDQGILGPIRNG
jgi:hypothetical protein